MSRILLIVPPLSKSELYARGSESSASKLPNLGVAFVAAFLIEHGHHVSIIDGIVVDISTNDVVKMAEGYDIVGVTAVSTYVVRSLEVVRQLKKTYPDKPLLVGGPHVTILPETLLRGGADYAVIGEGELTTLELVQHLKAGGGPPAKIPGVGYLDGDSYRFTGPRAKIDPLDKVPPPARDLLPMHLYDCSASRSNRHPSHSLFTSRGCPGVCSFCSKKTFGSKVRYFSVRRIVEEFFILRDKYAAQDIAIWDDNFASNEEIVQSVCEELIKRNFDLTWSIEARVDCVSRQTLEMLKSAGCNYIAYGFESGTQRILDYINKRTTLDTIRETVRMTKEVGIPIRGYFMLGFPTETAEEMQNTINFAKELDVEVASFTLFTPLPGTVEYRRAQESGQFDPEYFLHSIIPEFNFPDKPVYVPAGMTAQELLRIHKGAYSSYYFRPKMLLRHLSKIQSMQDVASLMKGGLTLIKNALHKPQ